MNPDRNTPNKTSEKASEEEPWRSESDTVEQRDRARTPDEPMSTMDEGAGITNRPLEEELRSQGKVPERGESREDAHAGHGGGDRNRNIEEE